ncbi:IS3 family transposase [Streptomyces zaomyceticus]|uniref:IS3 family transposase n=1 Tax=Streptomyces zaomyceticus TaxID=68286 RepID=UPI0037A70520
MIDHLRQKGLGVDPVCRVLELSPSTYFARKKRPKSARRLRDETLIPLIEEIHAESGGAYGTCRITRALRRKDVVVARCTVERLMAELGLEGVIRGRRRRTTVPEPSAPRPPGLGLGLCDVVIMRWCSLRSSANASDNVTFATISPPPRPG